MSKTSLSKIAAILAMGVSLCAAADNIVIPNLGTAGVRGMTIQAEKNYGEFFMRKANGAGIATADPVMNEYIDTIGNKLVINASNVYFPFEFFFSSDKTLNASAFLGGKVQINAGLFHYTDSEDEFASVIAHEISHVTQRHIARMIENQSDKMPVSIASIIGSIVIGLINPTVGAAALSSATGYMAQSGINFTRDNESEADRIGLSLLYAAGYNPMAMSDLFRKLLSTQGSINSAYAMLIDHPLSEVRVAESYNLAKNLPKRTSSKNANFMMAKARVDVRYMGYDLKSLKERLLKSSRVNPVYKKYALALICFEERKFEQALGYLDEIGLAENDFVLDLKTDIDLARGQGASAISRLKSVYAYKKKDSAIALNLANAYIEAKQPSGAIPVLKDFLISRPNHVLANSLLEKAYFEKKDKCNGFQYAAKGQILKGNYNQANAFLTDALHVCKGNDREIVRATFKTFNDIRDFDSQFEKSR
ncbi:MAG: M48 family metalloprotease [Succinivibrio sp.]